jgi:uncharacterized cofD-like protein
MEDGTVVAGEADIGVPRRDPAVPIRRVFLRPEARANPEAERAIRDCDVLLFAPGDLFTSTIPNLLVSGIPEALRAARARVIYVVNLMTRASETAGYTASRHVDAIARYGGRTPDAVLAHRGAIPGDLLARYAAEGATPVAVDVEALRGLGVKTVRLADIMSRTSLVRHDPARTAAALMDLIRELIPGKA